MRIEFDDEFHGHEELCPLSALKVYGKNMIDEFVEEHKTSEIINYENTDFQISEELKGIYKQMEEIVLKLAPKSIDPLIQLPIFLTIVQ